MLKARKKSRAAPAPRSAADWEEAALSGIAAGGLASLAIPELARSLGVTKGSFYWHFSGIRDLVEAALTRWEELDRATLEEIRQISNARARLKALFVQAMERRDAHRLLIALAGSSEPDVAAVLRRISEGRRRFLLDAYREIGLSRTAAREQALLAYSAYVGALHLRQQGAAGLTSEKDLAAYVAHAVKTLIPGR